LFFVTLTENSAESVKFKVFPFLRSNLLKIYIKYYFFNIQAEFEDVENMTESKIHVFTVNVEGIESAAEEISEAITHEAIYEANEALIHEIKAIDHQNDSINNNYDNNDGYHDDDSQYEDIK
jgi:hypothetical protein